MLEASALGDTLKMASQTLAKLSSHQGIDFIMC